MKVVGESQYQDALRAIAKKCVPGVEGRPSFPASLIPEPDNQYDRNAIAVHALTGKVGYLAREDAERYAATFAALRASGYDGGSCTGLLNGGDRSRPSFGVVLTLAYPEVCEMRFGISSGTRAAGAKRPAAAKVTSGCLRGRHFTEYVEDVKTLRRADREEEAEALLLELVEVVEAEAAEQGWGVAPWYYEQLAIIYRKRHDADAEIAILERHEAAPHAPGVGPSKLAERLEKARLRAARADR